LNRIVAGKRRRLLCESCASLRLDSINPGLSRRTRRAERGAVSTICSPSC
jgi:hypothetical protein